MDHILLPPQVQPPSPAGPSWQCTRPPIYTQMKLTQSNRGIKIDLQFKHKLNKQNETTIRHFSVWFSQFLMDGDPNIISSIILLDADFVRHLTDKVKKEKKNFSICTCITKVFLLHF